MRKEERGRAAEDNKIQLGKFTTHHLREIYHDMNAAVPSLRHVLVGGNSAVFAERNPVAGIKITTGHKTSKKKRNLREVSNEIVSTLDTGYQKILTETYETHIHTETL